MPLGERPIFWSTRCRRVIGNGVWWKWSASDRTRLVINLWEAGILQVLGKICFRPDAIHVLLMSSRLPHRCPKHETGRHISKNNYLQLEAREEWKACETQGIVVPSGHSGQLHTSTRRLWEVIPELLETPGGKQTSSRRSSLSSYISREGKEAGIGYTLHK